MGAPGLHGEIGLGSNSGRNTLICILRFTVRARLVRSLVKTKLLYCIWTGSWNAGAGAQRTIAPQRQALPHQIPLQPQIQESSNVLNLVLQHLLNPNMQAQNTVQLEFDRGRPMRSLSNLNRREPPPAMLSLLDREPPAEYAGDHRDEIDAVGKTDDATSER